MGYQIFGYFMFINYIIDQINAQISRNMVEKENQYLNITVCGIITSSNFWFLSNMGVFATNGVYSSRAFKTVFYQALPFYKFNLFSTLVFNIVIYGAHYLYNFLRNRNLYKKIDLVESYGLIAERGNALNLE